MSQRPNACHCPEVTIELKHFSPARTKPRDPAASSSSDVCTQCFGERPQKRPDLAFHRLWSRAELPEPSACSGWWTTTGLRSVTPHLALATVLVCGRHGGGPVLCPTGLSDPSPTAGSNRAAALHCFQVLVLCGCRWDLDLSTHFYLHCIWKHQTS